MRSFLRELQRRNVYKVGVMYAVGGWLLPRKKDSGLINVFQPVSGEPNEDWTDNFLTAVK